MIKFLLTTIGVLLSAVGFLYYLVNNSNFLPVDVNGNYLTVNILVLFILLLIILACVTVLLIWGIRQITLKPENEAGSIRLSLRYGILLTIGVLIVYLLHFFHILNFLWGSGILLVVILSFFVI
jgi:hypothetical protein